MYFSIMIGMFNLLMVDKTCNSLMIGMFKLLICKRLT